MFRALLVCAVAASVVADGGTLRASQAPAQANQSSPTPAIVASFEYTQRWFALVRAHRIGEWDASAAAAAQLPVAGLELIRSDLHIVYMLLDGAVTKGSSRVETPRKTLHLNSLARLIGVTPEELDLPTDLRNLGDRHITARRLLTRIMTRAAMMHTRIALERDIAAEPIDPPGLRATATLIRDGRQTRIPNRAVHWAIAREAFDIDGPPRAASATAKLWYHAAAAYLQQERDYAALQPHLQHAREIFKFDPLTFLFSGAAFENLAAPRIQAAIDESDGAIRALGSTTDLLQQADQYLRQALDLEPDLALAQLRRGRVLHLRGRYEEAAALLRQAAPGLTDPPARYLANLFLGKAEQARGRNAEAIAAYERAQNLWPAAQSPRLALASIAWRANDRTPAGGGVRALPAIDTQDISTDPFWTYDALHVGDVPALFERLRLMAIEAAK